MMMMMMMMMMNIEHFRHNRMFLDKKQGWCQIIARL